MGVVLLHFRPSRLSLIVDWCGIEDSGLDFSLQGTIWLTFGSGARCPFHGKVFQPWQGFSTNWITSFMNVSLRPSLETIHNCIGRGHPCVEFDFCQPSRIAPSYQNIRE
jgi:hypothetical protein